MPKPIDPVNQIEREGGADDVVEAIHAVMHLLRTEQHRALRGGPHDLTHMESKVLGFFVRRPGATQRDLAEHSGRDKGQLARLVGGLKARGLLDARADEADRRNVRLHPTADGRAVDLALRREGRRASERAVAGLGADERRQLVALLGKVRANLENAR